MKKIRKAIIPAAGLGTRFLPATKAQPKEMLPIVDIPTIQYIVEEAAASGITDILIILSRGKSVICDHFDRSPELEEKLLGCGRADLARQMQNISGIAFSDCCSIWCSSYSSFLGYLRKNILREDYLFYVSFFS